MESLPTYCQLTPDSNKKVGAVGSAVGSSECSYSYVPYGVTEGHGRNIDKLRAHRT